MIVKQHFGISRRQALKGMAAAAFPMILPSTVFGASAPSKRINVAMIGLGRQARHANLKPFLESGHTKVVALCDVDAWRLANAKEEVDKFYGNGDCRTYRDWREVIARDDIDAVINSTPDHWHVPISLAAVRAGKHVSCEKPLTLSIAEGRILADSVKQKGVVFRTDTECRSNDIMRKSAELVRNGYIGRLKHAIVTVPTGDIAGGDGTPMPVPEGLDYEMWLGPAPDRPYALDHVHPRGDFGRPGWMRCRDYCEGMITNWGAHVLDVFQLAHNSEHGGPVEVEGTGEYPAPGSGLWNVLLNFKARFRYADGVTVDYVTGEAAGIRFEGEEGWIQAVWLSDGNLQAGLTASNEAILKAEPKPDGIVLPRRADKEDFIYAIRTGQPVMIDAETGHRACSMGQIAHIAVQTGRKLAWDPEKERFAGDEQANAMLVRAYRSDWIKDVTK